MSRLNENEQEFGIVFKRKTMVTYTSNEKSVDDLYRDLVAKGNIKDFDNYSDFLDFMEGRSNGEIPIDNFITISGKYCFVQDSDFTIIAIWKFENDEIKDLFKKITKIENENETKLFTASFSNFFTFIIKKEFLKTIFKFRELQIRNDEPYYTFFKKQQKRNGTIKLRKIVAPVDEYCETLREMNHILQYVFDKRNLDFQVAYKKGKSVVDNARIHKNNKYIFKLDLKDFFYCCNRELVKNALKFMFEKIPNGEFILERFLDAILYEDALFIGSPISGCLANRIIADAAAYMKNIAHKFGMEFSIYSDDVTFSSDRYISAKCAEGIFKQGLVKFGLDEIFKLNEKKSVGQSYKKRRVTGISLNQFNEMTVSRYYYRELRSMFEHLMHNKPVNLQKMRGKVAYALMVDESGKIKKLLENYKPLVLQKHIINEDKFKTIFGGKH